jgi:glycosyltransferase involved in cell wall biosynthesis
MKIGIFTNNYWPNPYGVTQSIEGFRKSFEKNGHTVFIFAPRWKGFQDANPRVFRYPSLDISIKIKFPLAIPISFRADKALEKLDLDIIHSQHPNLLGWAARKWAKKKGIPLVFTWHALYDQYVHFAPFVPRRLAAWWVNRQAVGYANSTEAVVVPTDSVKKIIEKLGVKSKKIISIPSGVEEELYQNPDRNLIREKYGVKDSEILLLLISRLTAEKNVEFLFRSAMRILKNNLSTKFLVVGEGNLSNKLKKMVALDSLSGRVLFHGLVDKKEIKNFYAAGDIFIFASKSETQGMILSEAMYAGLPVVGVDAPGTRDLVENEVSGLLVGEDEEDFSEAVVRLIQNADLRKTFSDNARRIAREKYTDRACAKKMMALYESLIKSP